MAILGQGQNFHPTLDTAGIIERARGTSLREVQNSGMLSSVKGVSGATGLATSSSGESKQDPDVGIIPTTTRDMSTDQHTGNVNPTTLRTITIPANTLGLTGGLDLELFGQGLCANSAGNTVTIQWDGEDLAILGFPMSATVDWLFKFRVANEGVANAQRGYVQYHVFDTILLVYTTEAIDTTVDTDIVISTTLGHASDTMRLHGHFLTYF